MIFCAAIEHRAEMRFADGHSDRVADSLPERAGRRLDTGRVAVLGVAGSLALPLAELLQIIESEIVAGEIEHAVEKHRRMAARQNEAVTIHPFRIGGIISQMPGPEHVGERRQRHRCARMAGVRFLNRIHREDANGVDAQSLQIRVAAGRRSALGRRRSRSRLGRVCCR